MLLPQKGILQNRLCLLEYTPHSLFLLWKRECAVYGGREKTLLSKLAASASLGNAVLNCSAQRLVSPCVARAGCGAYQVLYAVLIVT